MVLKFRPSHPKGKSGRDDTRSKGNRRGSVRVGNRRKLRDRTEQEIRRSAASELLAELKSSRLEVIRKGFTRVAIGQNADWYRDFCAAYARNRRGWKKHKTLIERQHTIRALNHLIHGTTPQSPIYCERLEPYIEERARQICLR